MEECADSLAFASEPVLASLANVLAYQEQQANNVGQSSSNVTKQTSSVAGHRATYAKEYELLDIEIKYGLLQVRNATGAQSNLYSCHILYYNNNNNNSFLFLLFFSLFLFLSFRSRRRCFFFTEPAKFFIGTFALLVL